MDWLALACVYFAVGIASGHPPDCDSFIQGIIFSVRPPKKSWKNITQLSGGEKTLSSLALVFALHHFKPTPLYFMDEIDAALDFKNVSIVAHYVKEQTKYDPECCFPYCICT